MTSPSKPDPMPQLRRAKAKARHPWVIEHNEGLIRNAHEKGIPRGELKNFVSRYMESEPVRRFFKDERPAFFGQSLERSGHPADDPRAGKAVHGKIFSPPHPRHHLRFPRNGRCRSSSAGLRVHHSTRPTFRPANDALHTALSDATDMAMIYFKQLDLLQPKAK